MIKSLRRGTPRPEALRQADVDPISFAAEYHRSAEVRAAIIGAEGGTLAGDSRSPHSTYLPPVPHAAHRPEAAAAEPVETPASVSGSSLLLVVLAPLVLSLILLAAGAAPDVPSLGW